MWERGEGRRGLGKRRKGEKQTAAVLPRFMSSSHTAVGIASLRGIYIIADIVQRERGGVLSYMSFLIVSEACFK